MKGLESRPRVTGPQPLPARRALPSACPSPPASLLWRRKTGRMPPAPVELGRGRGPPTRWGLPGLSQPVTSRTCTKAKVQLMHSHVPSPATGDAHTPAPGRVLTQAPLTEPTDLHKGVLWIAPLQPPCRALLTPSSCPSPVPSSQMSNFFMNS